MAEDDPLESSPEKKRGAAAEQDKGLDSITDFVSKAAPLGRHCDAVVMRRSRTICIDHCFSFVL